MGYLFLTISIAMEVLATSLLKISDGMTVVWALIASLASYGVSFYFLGITLRTIPLSVAYAIWAGAGTVLTAIISVIFWDELFNGLKIIAILLIIGGLVVLNLSDKGAEAK